MATYTVDKKLSDSDVSNMLDDALCQQGYPEPENIDLIDFKEYDRATRQVFLWVSTLFTLEEEKFLLKYFKENLHPRTVTAICRNNHHFGHYDEDFEDTD